ncbi:MAG: hypothetical protein IT205_01825 [Fimbriimonadaceae bacterium]|nr:hypothetical protein [Fimbriimonadaceae bacterium]
MRSLFAGLIVVCVASAKASFELMYIPSSSEDRIIRYDPINRVQLGGIPSDLVSSVAYGGGQYGLVRTNGQNVRYNMYTGIGTSLATGSSPAGMSHDSQTVLSFVGQTMHLNNLSSGANSTTTIAGSVAPLALVKLASGYYAGFGVISGSLFSMRISPSGGSVSSSNLGLGITRAANSSAIVSIDENGETWVRMLVRTTTASQTLVSSRVWISLAQL